MFIIIISLLAAGAQAAGAVYFANPIGEDFPVRDPSRKLSAVAAECDGDPRPRRLYVLGPRR